MNEFTKEELVSLKFHVDSSFAQDDDTEGLMIKIQSMIDNYAPCNHSEIVIGAYSRSNPPNKCDICGVLYR